MTTSIKPFEEFQIEVFHRQFLRESIALFGKCIIWGFTQGIITIIFYAIIMAIAAASSEAAIGFIILFFIALVISGVAYVVFMISEIVKLINYHAIIKKNEQELLSRIPAIEIKNTAPKGL